MNVCGRDIRIDGTLLRVARLAAEKYEFLDDATAAVELLRQSGVRIDLFTFMQNLSQTSPKYDYPLQWDNLAALPISGFDQWWNKQINGKTRNMIRRAEKAGVVVREVPFDESLVEGISAIYNECPTRQGRQFWHYGKDLAAVRAENGTFLDRSVFLGAFADSRLIGFAKLVSDEQRAQAGLMQILSMIQYRDKAPTNALIAQAVRSCAGRGIPYLVYANFSYGNKQRDTLGDFKLHNGFQRIELPRYYVPLTLVGRAALAMGLHHGVRTHVPETVLASLRKARRLWQDHLLLSPKETL
jgi:hypothetical protein